MESRQIQKLIDQKNFPEETQAAELIETHISYVILTDHLVYKIKKPFHYSFLDFSTLEKRKFYCEEELRLNSRLAAPMYNRVLPIRSDNGMPFIADPNDESQSPIIDYTLEMNKMDTSLEMDKLLEKGEVQMDSIDKIAQKIADFHSRAETIYKSFDLPLFKQKFNDISSVKDWLEEMDFQEQLEQINYATKASDHFLDDYQEALKKRNDNGHVKDCHGDLHSKNIFLYDDPVIFDCIEFNKNFRQIDTLNEIAFFCMDLEVNNHFDFSKHFFQQYCQLSSEEDPDCEETSALFTYFKGYRANVRGKVIALKLKELTGGQLAIEGARLEEMKSYFHLMKYYLNKLGY